MSPYYTANTAFVVFSMMIMMAAVGFNTTLDDSSKKATRLLFLVISVAAVCEWAGNALQGADVRLIGLHKLVKFVELSCAPFIGLICGRSLSRRVQLHVPLTCIFVFHALLELRSVFTGTIWEVDAQNIYHHGPWYGVYIFFYMIGVVYYLLHGIGVFRRYQQSGGIMILLVTAFLMAGIVVSLWDNGVEIVWLVVAMAAIMLYKFYGDILQEVDGLTELGNRWAFEDYLNHYHGPGVILYVDVDDFKQVNDTHGHTVGDQCLCTLANGLRAVYGRCGRCFRLGGDEFCVVMHRDLGRVEQLNEELLRRRERNGSGLPLPDISIGYAAFDTAHESMEEALERADQAMYQVKHAHKQDRPVR